MPPIKVEGIEAERCEDSLNSLSMTPDSMLQQSALGSADSIHVASPDVTAPSSAATLPPDTPLRRIKAEPSSAEIKQDIKQEQVHPDVNSVIPAHNDSISTAASLPISPQDSEERESHEVDSLEQWATETSPEILEKGVKIGMELLESLKVPLGLTASLPETQGSTWLKAINDIQSRSQPPKTIVGVVGNTGAGKSSVINALLDEERLLPTNCLRACTASPTEISYNHSQNPEELYRSEIEFISLEDWKKELKTLFTDLLDDSGNISRDCTNEDSEAGIAYAKIRAVYPSKTKEMIAESSPEKLANEPAVARVLGTVKKLTATTAKDLYASMQRYVDSKEKNPHSKKNVQMEFWPLIKVVRIFTKANALSTGAVVVDLPGVQDSNVARAAVAQNYMKSCTGLWIVAPINRAVDDKTAKSLLGDSFKRQLKYDGIYSAVTFICSKTDDISVTEAAESLDIESDISESWAKIEDFRRKLRDLKQELSNARDEKADLIECLEQTDSDWDKWDELANKCADGETVYAPSENSRKRKRGSSSSRSRKNRRSSDSDDSPDDSDLNSDSDKENNPDNENRQPLTEDKIQEKLADLKNLRKEIRQSRKEVDARLSDIREEIKKIQSEEGRLLGKVKSICIQGRNGYAKGAIQRDFAMGIKELDQEAAIEENEQTFNPDEDIRDYDEVARNLPVFCVSSRAYQKIRGRLQKDDFNNEGFRDVNETEIPQLQQHAKKLTEGGRAANCRRFLNDLRQLLNSMRMWAANDGTQAQMTDRDKWNKETTLRAQLSSLEKDFTKAVDECVAAIKDALSESIYDFFDQSIPAASDAAVPTASGWGAHRSEGGMFWATYKATCRRAGVYTGASGPRDFNAELFEPISRQLATGWERAFQRRLPRALESFAISARLLLEDFHRNAVSGSLERGNNHAGINMLSNQLRAHTARLKEIPVMIKTVVQELQREASRGFHPVIEQEMQPAYNICVAESGPGSYARMKSHMVNHVENARHTMFRHSTDSVKEQLRALCRRVEDEITQQVQDIYNLLARDYLAVIVGVDNNAQHSSLPRSERLLRAEMRPILETAGQWFARSGSKDVSEALHTPEDEGDPFADQHETGLEDVLALKVGDGGDLAAVKSEPFY
ncbi:Dynamin family-domain-containing protein [Colletotrichum navitas]|uniref:Dynamin family-domain-containing protein n=1 Tax=Colletotrichum navitas TaxID=681940 RepID=A0AAD8Q0T1_9PEZI|nr:Dynamin family-domain-containing protein [Colletotrichum navitas]KAK1593767.1 Dynamin family-domain-containing protein [Colletotrichum navitas]